MVSLEQDHMSLSSYTITDVAVVDVEKGILHPDQTAIVVGDRVQLNRLLEEAKDLAQI